MAIDQTRLMSRVLPTPNSRFSFADSAPQNIDLLQKLNIEISDGECPNEDYEGIDYHIQVTNDSSDFNDLKASFDKIESGVFVIIHNPSSSSISTIASEQKIKAFIRYGENFKDLIRQMMSLSEDVNVSKGFDVLLGHQYDAIFERIIDHDELEIDHWHDVKRLLKLGFISNSFSSCSHYLYQMMSNKGYIFSSFKDLFDDILPLNFIEDLLEQAEQRIKNDLKPDALNYLVDGQKRIASILESINKVSAYLPSPTFLMEFFWSKFNSYLKEKKEMFDFLMKMSKAKTTFESNMLQAMGSEAITQIFGAEGSRLYKNSGKYAELMIGGGLFGSIPFLIGTVYQIIYDIINLIINLVWYAGKGIQGVLAWILSLGHKPAQDQISADKDLLKMLIFDFDLKKFFSKDLPSIFSLLLKFTKKAVNSFIDHAAEYGQTVGKFLGNGLVKIGSGALQLITKGYPKKPNLMDRFIWLVKQWFNIGCLLGPIIVDIVLMFCSGGTTGIFSAAAKMGKLGKLGEAARFAGKAGESVKSLTVFSKVGELIPKKLNDLIETLINQLWAITSYANDVLKTFVAWASKSKGDVLTQDDLVKFGEKLDQWFTIASFVNLFAALAYMIIGNDHSKISREGKLVAS